MHLESDDYGTQYIVKVAFQNGDSIVMNIQGTKGKIVEYYKVGNVFNIGVVADDMQKITGFWFLEA